MGIFKARSLHQPNLSELVEEPGRPDLLTKGTSFRLYFQPENKVALGFVERLNNKNRVLQRRAYGLHDEEYLRLKILTCMLPEI